MNRWRIDSLKRIVAGLNAVIAPCDPEARRQSSAGGALLEVTVVLPFLLVTVVGAADFGRAIHQGMVLEGAAHAAARFASQSEEATINANGIANAAFAALSLDSSYSYDGEQETEYDGESRPPCAQEHREQGKCDGAVEQEADRLASGQAHRKDPEDRALQRCERKLHGEPSRRSRPRGREGRPVVIVRIR